MSGGHEQKESETDLNDRKQLEDVDERQKKRLILANVFYLRSRHFKDLFTAAFEALPYAKAYFGDQVFENLNTLIRARQSVLIYADAYAQDEGGR